MSACCFTRSATDPASAMCRGSPLTVVVFIDYAAFHHEPHMFEGRDVFCGIAVDGDQVGKLAGHQRSSASFVWRTPEHRCVPCFVACIRREKAWAPGRFHFS